MLKATIDSSDDCYIVQLHSNARQKFERALELLKSHIEPSQRRYMEVIHSWLIYSEAEPALRSWADEIAAKLGAIIVWGKLEDSGASSILDEEMKRMLADARKTLETLIRNTKN